jgi:hypothetical protein
LENQSIQYYKNKLLGELLLAVFMERNQHQLIRIAIPRCAQQVETGNEGKVENDSNNKMKQLDGP